MVRRKFGTTGKRSRSRAAKKERMAQEEVKYWKGEICHVFAVGSPVGTPKKDIAHARGGKKPKVKC